jgi:IS5 family transposase
MDRLIREDDTAVYATRSTRVARRSAPRRRRACSGAVKENAKPGRRLTARQRARNHRFGKLRAKVEHVVRFVQPRLGLVQRHNFVGPCQGPVMVSDQNQRDLRVRRSGR